MTKNPSATEFSMRDKIGYMLGNMGNDFMFAFAGVFLMVFYTKVLGISSGIVGAMFLIARFLDAVTDIGMGHLIDRRKPTKGGKFRPYLLFLAIPVAVGSFLMYQYAMASTPMAVRIVYMFVTYFLWGSILYTAVNIPYGSMASVMTGDASERASLSVARSIGSVAVNLIVGIFIPLAVYEKDTAGNEVVNGKAFTAVAAILAVLTVICYFLCYFMTKERISAPKAETDKVALKDSVSMLLHSRSLIAMILATVVILAAQILTQSISQYLFIDYFNSKSAIAAMTAVTMLPGLALAPFTVLLTKKFGKKNIAVFGSFAASLSCFLLYFMRTKSPALYILIVFLGFIGFSVFNLIMWAFITDVIDDEEVKNSRRDDGTIYGAYSFARKIGQALAGGLGGFALAIIGFDSAVQVQTVKVANGIYTVATLIPAVLYLLSGLIFLLFYPLGKKEVQQNAEILKLRKEKGEEPHA